MTHQPADPNPVLNQRALPAQVIASRKVAQRYYSILSDALRPSTDGHLTGYDHVVERLTILHSKLTDDTDLDIDGSSRWLAIWELSGWCISLARALLFLTRVGFSPETLPTGRTLHEATRVLHAISDSTGDDLLRRWLEGEQVTEKQALRVNEQIEKRAYEEMRAAGAVPPESSKPLSGFLYGIQSKAAHSVRDAVRRSVSQPLRTMVSGPHPDPASQAVTVLWTGLMVEEMLLSVGGALMRIFGGEWYRQEIVPLQQAILAMRDTFDLSKEKVEELRNRALAEAHRAR